MNARRPQGRHRAAPARPTSPRHAAASEVRGRHAATAHRGARRSLVIVVAAACFVGSAGAAAAAWLAQGEGAAAGRATSAKDVVIAAGTPTAELYPGFTGSVRLTVANPNPYAVRLTQAKFGQVTVTPFDGRTCAATTTNVVAAAGLVTLGSPVNLPAGSGPVPVTILNALTMPPEADTGCQDATFTVVVTLSGASA